MILNNFWEGSRINSVTLAKNINIYHRQENLSRKNILLRKNRTFQATQDFPINFFKIFSWSFKIYNLNQ